MSGNNNTFIDSIIFCNEHFGEEFNELKVKYLLWKEQQIDY